MRDVRVNETVFKSYIHKLEKAKDDFDKLSDWVVNDDRSGIDEEEVYNGCKLFLENLIQEMKNDLDKV